MKTVMSRCHGCESTIKKADVFHKTDTTITGLPYRGWRDVGSTFYAPDYWCCNCVGHEVGKCREQIAYDLYTIEFKMALVRSLGGVSRVRFLESDIPMRRYYESQEMHN